jgi:SAM-dependent methyltransferase
MLHACQSRRFLAARHSGDIVIPDKVREMAIEAASPSVARSKCFLCGEASEQVVWKEDGIEGLRCGCGMVYTNQSTIVEPLDLARDFHPDHFYSLPAEFKASWVARNCPHGRLVEVGCGAGFFLTAARSLGYEVMGLEPNRAYGNRLQQLGIPVANEVVERNSLPRRSFDVVYHCDLLAHFPDPIRSLAAMCDLLSPTGVLCFEVGLLGGISPLWYTLVGRIGLGQHLWLYSDRAFRNLMRKAGLEIVRIQYFGLAPEVIGGRILGVLDKHLLRPALQTVSRDGADRALRVKQSCLYFLRYRAGVPLPHIGPQTLLVVAKPTNVQ